MLIIMEDKIELFVHGLKRWAKTKPHKKIQGELAAAIGKSQPTISDYFNFKYAPEPKDINLWVDAFNLNENEIIELGKVEKRRAEGSDGYKINIEDYRDQVLKIMSEHSNMISIDQDHADIIRLFQNQALAKEINHMLVVIEKDDPDKLHQIKKILDTFMPQKKRKASNDKR